MNNSIKIALLGSGTVGTQVARLLRERAGVLAARAGAQLELVGIAVKNLDAPRDVAIDRALLTDNPYPLIDAADVVIELIGGIDPARAYVRYALEHGKSVVTGNKALLATHGPELYELAASSDVDLYYEAAVAGAVPVVYGLRESLAGDRVNTVMGIMNGTTNFILDQMTAMGLSFDEALQTAQELGFAEADPTADVDGYDAAAKIAILASLAFHMRVSLDDVQTQGIRDITAEDIASADAAGYVIKLIALARRHTQACWNGDNLPSESVNAPSASDSAACVDAVELHVAPTLVAKNHPLASVGGSFNAVLVDAESAGRLMFYGRGAGGAPTASAVLSDVVAAAAKRVVGGHAPREVLYGGVQVLAASEAKSSYYIKLRIEDRVGLLAVITQIFADHDVSISSVNQSPMGSRERSEAQCAGVADVVITTHEARAADVESTVEALRQIEGVCAVQRALRVEEN